MGALSRFVYGASRAWWKIAKPITVGVRVLLIRDEEVLLVRHTYQLDRSSDRREIASSDFFPIHCLPDGASPGTQRRIEEYLGGSQPCVGYW